MINSIIDHTKIGKWAKYSVNWLANILKGKTPYIFEHNKNQIRSNVDKETLLSTRKGFTNDIKAICIQYADGKIKQFDEYQWTCFGNGILKNCKKIKVIAIYE